MASARERLSCIHQLCTLITTISFKFDGPFSLLYVKSVTILPTRKSFNYFVFHQQTPSHLAAEKGRFENTLKYLVDKQADINFKDNDGVNIMLLYY